MKSAAKSKNTWITAVSMEVLAGDVASRKSRGTKNTTNKRPKRSPTPNQIARSMPNDMTTKTTTNPTGIRIDRGPLAVVSPALVAKTDKRSLAPIIAIKKAKGIVARQANINMRV